MSFIRRFRLFIALALCAALASCGSHTETPTSSEGTSYGTITAKESGAITVNGVKFPLAGAAITVDGSAGAEADLKTGMVVRVSGVFSGDGTTGTATAVVFADVMRGPVAGRDSAVRSLMVLGQTVVIDDATVFEGTTFDGIVAGGTAPDTVRVSGFTAKNGSVLATHVQKVTGLSQYELKGVIGLVNTGAQTFQIGGLTVDHHLAGMTFTPARGMNVGVVGTVDAAGTFLASAVLMVSGPSESSGRAETEDVVTDTGTGSLIRLGTRGVALSAATRYVNGTAADIALNVRLEAEGTVGSSGAIIATKIIFGGTRFEIAGQMQRAGSAGELTILAVPVSVNALTETLDSTGGVSPLTLSNLQNGDWLFLKGIKGSSGRCTATYLERTAQPVDFRSMLRGAVDSAVEPNLIILGVTVSTISVNDNEFRDSRGTSIGRTTFYGTVRQGRLVRAKGLYNGSLVMASTIQFDN